MRSLKLIGVASAAAFAGVAAACGCGGALEANHARGAQQPATDVVSVTVTAPGRRSIERSTSQPGQIEAYETTELHAKVAAYVKSIAVDIGDDVKSGRAIAELDDPELYAQLKQKQAAVRVAEAELRQTRVAVDVAKAAVANTEAKASEALASVRRTEADVARWQAEFDRTAQLVQERVITSGLLDETRSKLEASRSASEEAAAKVQSARTAIDQAKAELTAAEADVTAAEARVEAALADRDRAQALTEYLTIRAPFDGVITRRFVHAGHLTVPGGAGHPLFVIERSDRVRVAVGVPEIDASFVDPGDKADVRFQALGGRVITGTVARTSWSLDERTRTMRAEIEIDNPKGVLRPGMYAQATIVGDKRTDVLTLPVAAVVRDARGTFCVIARDGKAVQRPITTGLSDGSHVEVVSGISEVDLVVTNNPGAIQDGQPVKIDAPPRK